MLLWNRRSRFILWAVFAVRRHGDFRGADCPRGSGEPVDAVFHLPIRSLSMAIGLGLLTAFNERPFLLGGTKWIVIVAHAALVRAFVLSSVSAALLLLVTLLARLLVGEVRGRAALR